jgi:hypothetical protein
MRAACRYLLLDYVQLDRRTFVRQSNIATLDTLMISGVLQVPDFVIGVTTILRNDTRE